MSSVATTSKFSFSQVALPAVVVLLSGLSLAYSFGAGGDIGNRNGVEFPATSSESIVIAAKPRSESLAVNSRLDGLTAHYNFHAPVPQQGAAETAPVLMLLHKRMADARGQQGDRDRLIGELDRVHGAESIDATWAAQSEMDILSASIQPVMTETDLKPQDVATDCRSSTCRISARFTDSNDAENWGTMLITQMGGTLSQVKMTILPQPDGSSEVRIYGARKQSSRG